MSETVGSTLDDRGQLDELVPAPWSAGRRALASVIALGVVVVVLAAVLSGALGPRLDHANSWGANVDRPDDEATISAERIAHIENTGWLPVTLEELVLPTLDDVTWGGVTGLPATLAPGEMREVVIRFEVEDCGVDVAGYDVFPVRASSGIAPSRVVDVAPPFSGLPSGGTVLVDEDGDEIRAPGLVDQPASWIIDTVEPACTMLPDEAL